MSLASWGHQVTMDWLVLQLTGSSAALGGMLVFQLAPYIFISLVGGSVADKFNKRNFLMLVTAINAIFAFSLFALYHAGALTYTFLAVVALLLGTVNAMESPVRTSLSMEVVEEENRANVMGLNSVTFNIGRLIGTLMAGLLMAHIDNGAPWLLFGMIYLLLFAILPLLRVHEIAIEKFGESKPGKMSDAVKYLRQTPFLFLSMALAAICYGLGMGFGLTSSLMVNKVFLEDASYLGYIGIAVSVGSIIGAAIAARWSVPGHIPQLSTMLVSGILVALVWMLSSVMPTFWLYALVTCIASIFGLAFMVTSNSLVVLSAPEDFRGRIYGIYLFIFYIGATLGGPIIGRIAEHFGVRIAIFFGGAATLIISVGTLVRTRSRESH